MKKVFLFGVIALVLYACSTGQSGNLTGVLGRPTYQPEVPLGMVYIKGGGFTLGESDQDITFQQQSRARTVSISAFYMDATEITNNEYRQFVYHVQDSLSRERIFLGLLDGLTISSGEEGEGDAEAEGGTESKYDQITKYKNPKKETEEEPAEGEEGASNNHESSIKKEERTAYTRAFIGIDEDEEYYDDIERGFIKVDDPFLIANSKNVKNRYKWNYDQTFSYDDKAVVPLLSDLYLPPNERFYNQRQIDTRKLMFRYWWLDTREAAVKGTIELIPNGHDWDLDSKSAKLDVDQQDSYIKEQGREQGAHRKLVIDEKHPRNKILYTGDTSGLDLDLGHINKKGQNNAIRGHVDRERFIIEEVINVYPDTLCWVRDFTYSFNDPMTNMYFSHPAYDNYPLVGVTWQQAKAFSVWRTQLLNNWATSQEMLYYNDFRLPSEAEWERAARGDLALQPYPWGGPYIRNAYGCFMANFKPMRGRYFEDGGFYTVKVHSYSPNNFGLYCMAGNVAEWCETAYDESAYEFYADVNPEHRYDAKDWDLPRFKQKVVRGGSWKDIAYYCTTYARNYEYQDTAKSYIGFRNVMNHLGRGSEYPRTSEGYDFSRDSNEEAENEIELR